MASLATTAQDRRADGRVPPERTSWRPTAMLRPGQGVVLLNISRCAALIESGARLRPGLQTELQLSGALMRRTISGRLERCHVAGVDPLRYRGVVVFEAPMDLIFEHAHCE